MNKGHLAKDLSRARKALGLNGDDQRDLLKALRTAYSLSNDELAAELGVSLGTLLAYLSTEGTAKHRRMPEGMRLALSVTLKARKSDRKSRKAKP